ncbi:putative HTH-type transcriptional regulator YbbH [Roseovarius albus]|uniref:Putative HTH-type transcriptional regulator YbbH n=1 Tax=Roseovarius albus TaxID=1247867 RepID=A0A1X6YMH6_9RHOB|nr:MurR/RpiR family transcriptional regulator [Roseovarius albus]SLN25779.1 putative HTH-type transcriptional regulator YbbH [Roseovarius albus]
MDPTLKSKTLLQLKIEFSTFPPRMQRVAKYILDNQSDFGLDPVRVTASKAGVSTYTLVRAAKTLGFNGFDDLRAPFRHALVATTAYEERPEWIETQQSEGTLGPVQADSTLNTLSIVQHSLQRLDPVEVERAVETLLNARNVYITAVRASYSLAYYFHYVGRMALPSLQLIPRHMNSALDELTLASSSDVMIAITISPYSRETIEACKFAQSRGVKLIFLTDSDLISPDLIPEHVFAASTVSTHHFACFTGLMGIAESLLAALVSMGGTEARKRIKDYEDLRAANSAYWVRQKKR